MQSIILSPIVHPSALLMAPGPRKSLILVGGGNAYPPEMRDQVISLWENRVDIQRSPWIAELRDEKQFPCWKTCQRWIELYNSEGHTLRKRAICNRISERVVNGQDLVNLAVYRMVRPKAYIDEVGANVHNMNPENPPYS